MKASRVMTRSVTYVRPDDLLEAVWSLMTELGVRHLPVLDGERLVGILSDRDLLAWGERTTDGRIRFSRVEARAVMTPAPITCLMNAKVSHLAKLMLEERIDCVPVTDGAGRLLGLVTSADLLGLLCESEPAYQEIPFQFTLRDAAEARAAASEGS